MTQKPSKTIRVKLDTISGSAPAKPKLATAAGTKSKQTLYVDVDDEITSIIDKVIGSKSEIVALVLPKRAAVLQSIVNMKLLKRSAEQNGKNLVLVTTEAGLLPLAGIVGMHVASTPTAKPNIPPAPEIPGDEPDQVDESQVEDFDEESPEEDFDPSDVGSTPIGVLAGAAKANEPESLELPDEDLSELEEKPEVVPLKKRNNKLVVPNFDSFRNKVLLGVLGLLLLGGLYYIAFFVLPKTTINISSETTTVKSSFSMTLDTKATTLNEDQKIVPATSQSINKTASGQSAATGQLNNGTKATGTVKLSVTKCAPNLEAPSDISTGSGVSSGGKTYILQEAGEFLISGASGSCVKYSTDKLAITALKAGADYNLNSATFSASNGSSGTGTTSGGTDSIVKVVSQSDIDTAKAKANLPNNDQIKQELALSLKAKGLMPIFSTFAAGDQQVTPSANAGDKADSVTVTVNAPFTMLGIKQADLKTLILANVKKQIDEDKQKVLKDGLSDAQFTQDVPATATSASVGVRVTSVAGPFIDIEEIKRNAAGKKEASIRANIQDIPGVTGVEVNYSPFWVSKAPRDISKITVNVDKADQ